MKTRRTAILVAAALLLGACTTGTAGEKDAEKDASNLDEVMKGVAKTVADHLKAKNVKPAAVSLTTVVNPTDPAAGSGEGLRRLLKKYLAEEKVSESDDSPYTISGEYQRLLPKTDESIKVRLKLRIHVKDEDEVEREMSYTVTHLSNDVIARLMNMSLDLREKQLANPDSVKKEIRKQAKEPPAPVVSERTKVSVAEDTFAVEVLRDEDGGKNPTMPDLKPVPAAKKGKGVKVVLRHGDYYRLRLYNPEDYEVAASVSIDGVDVFAFFKGGVSPTHFVVPAKGHVEVAGWVFATDDVPSFKVGTYGDSAAAKKGADGKGAGVIHVCFHHTWEGDTPPARAKGVPKNKLATGFGPPTGASVKPVERTIGPLLTAVAVRYANE